jgi:hypothetical protein
VPRRFDPTWIAASSSILLQGMSRLLPKPARTRSPKWFTMSLGGRTSGTRKLVAPSTAITVKNPGSAATGFGSPESSVPGSVRTSRYRPMMNAPHASE